MKPSWLVVIVLGVALAGCGEVAAPAVADSEQAHPDPIDIESIARVEEARPVPAVEGVSAMGIRCEEDAYVDGACGCDAGSACGYSQTRYHRTNLNCTNSCLSCATYGAWINMGTKCIASSSCTIC